MAVANAVEVNAMVPHVVHAGDEMGLCINFPTSGWHTFMNFTACYVFYLEDLTVKESMMAYGYELGQPHKVEIPCELSTKS